MTSQIDISNIYMRTKMKRILAVPASELTSRFDENLLLKLRNEVEGKCNKEGYIEKGSVEIINHGTLNTEVIRYKGDVRVPVEFTGKVVNPVIGEVIECQVHRFNDFGIKAFAGPLKIVIPFGDRKSTGFNIGQKLKVRIIKSDIILNDNQIEVYATFYDEKDDKKEKPLLEEELVDQATDEEDAEVIGESGDEIEEVPEDEEIEDTIESESEVESGDDFDDDSEDSDDSDDESRDESENANEPEESEEEKE